MVRLIQIKLSTLSPASPLACLAGARASTGRTAGIGISPAPCLHSGIPVRTASFLPVYFPAANTSVTIPQVGIVTYCLLKKLKGM